MLLPAAFDFRFVASYIKLTFLRSRFVAVVGITLIVSATARGEKCPCWYTEGPYTCGEITKRSLGIFRGTALEPVGVFTPVWVCSCVTVVNFVTVFQARADTFNND